MEIPPINPSLQYRTSETQPTIDIDIRVSNAAKSVLNQTVNKGLLEKLDDLKKAIFQKDIETVNFIISAYDMTESKLGEACVFAAEHGNLKILTLLMEKNKGVLPIPRINQIFLWAANGGRTDILIYFIQTHSSLISKATLEQAIYRATRQGHIENLKFLLLNIENISEEKFSQILNCAIEKGNLAIVHFLLLRPEFKSLSGDQLGIYIKKAALYNDPDNKIIKLLIDENKTRITEGANRSISSDILIEAICNAHIGNTDCILLLFEEIKHLSASTNILEQAATKAIENGNVFVLNLILNEIEEGKIQNVLIQAICGSARGNNIDVLKYLILNHGKNISIDTIGNAAVEAAKKGFVPILWFLIQHSPIQPKYFDIIRENLIQEKHVAISEETRIRIEILVSVGRGQPYVRNLFFLAPEMLKRHPTDYLRSIFENGMPPRIFVIDDTGNDSPVIDVGGVTKQFITILSQSLLDNKILSSTGLPKCNKDQISTFEYLGRLVSVIYQNNLSRSDKILTGYLFPEFFLKMVKTIALQDGEEQGFIGCCEIIARADPALAPAANLVINPTADNKLKYLSSIGEERESNTIDPNDPVVNEARDYMALYYHPARGFCEGMEGPFSIDLSKGNLQDFQGQLVTAQGLLKAINIFDSYGNKIELSSRGQDIVRRVADGDIALLRNEIAQKKATEGSLTSQSFLDHVDWLIEEIVIEEPKWLRDFVFSVTGKQTLINGTFINLKQNIYDANKSQFKIATCLNEITMPSGSFNRDEFISALKAVSQGDSFNNN